MNVSRQRFADNGADQFEMRMTRWRNPTEAVQRIVLFDSHNRKQVVTFRPGEEKDIPSEYDYAIQRVDCGEESCHRHAAHYCRAGHSGTIVAGLAPLLQRVGFSDKLDPTLDPAAAEKAKAEADMIAAATAKRAAEDALVVSAAKAEAKRPK